MKQFTECKTIIINKKSSRQNAEERAKTVQWQSLSSSLFVIFNGNLKCVYFQWVDMTFFNRIRPDPGFVSPVRSEPGFVSPVRSDPGFVSPIRSRFCQSDPIRSGPVQSRFCQRPYSAHSYIYFEMTFTNNRWILLMGSKFQSRIAYCNIPMISSTIISNNCWLVYY